MIFKDGQTDEQTDGQTDRHLCCKKDCVAYSYRTLSFVVSSQSTSAFSALDVFLRNALHKSHNLYHITLHLTVIAVYEWFTAGCLTQSILLYFFKVFSLFLTSLSFLAKEPVYNSCYWTGVVVCPV